MINYTREWKDIHEEANYGPMICYNINQFSRIKEVFLPNESSLVEILPVLLNIKMNIFSWC